MELQLAPPATEVPPRLHVGGVEVGWFSLDWNSDVLSSVLPAEVGNAVRLDTATEVSFVLLPAAKPIGFEVAVYDGSLNSSDPAQPPAQILDCIQEGSTCELTEKDGEAMLTVTGLTDAPHVLVIQARYFAPPEVNPDRLANEVAWLVELQNP